MLQLRQKAANQEVDVQELHAAVQSEKNRTQRAEDDGCR